VKARVILEAGVKVQAGVIVEAGVKVWKRNFDEAGD
jgi:hypothetical protein